MHLAAIQDSFPGKIQNRGTKATAENIKKPSAVKLQIVSFRWKQPKKPIYKDSS
jgi:hypothetical protein